LEIEPIHCHETSVKIATRRCVMSQKSADLNSKVTYTGNTQKNGAVLIVNTIKTAPFFCVCPVYDIRRENLETSFTNAAVISALIHFVPIPCYVPTGTQNFLFQC
jgi:hypothetical protein